jgi:hypothetical protein
VVVGWGTGIVVFLVVTASQSGLLNRVEGGFLAGCVAAAATMAVMVAVRLSRGQVTANTADLVEASHDLPLEP